LCWANILRAFGARIAGNIQKTAPFAAATVNLNNSLLLEEILLKREQFFLRLRQLLWM
jgi:hypothetical protein